MALKEETKQALIAGAAAFAERVGPGRIGWFSPADCVAHAIENCPSKQVQWCADDLAANRDEAEKIVAGCWGLM